MPRPCTRVLIANRGEIARRIVRAVHAEGLTSIAACSDADAQALHVREAHEAVRLGPAPPVESYLHIARIIDAARLSGADAVHPGYGFLAENAQFARACTEAGLVFIGPGADTIALMGSKRLAKQVAAQAGVPCVAGSAESTRSDAELLACADVIGYPLVIKASAGGGGRGLRIVHAREALPAELALARAEARSAFGDDELILERLVSGSRHIEVQVLADAFGNVVHLGERDCSAQRRHQKVIEEAPSPAVDTALRARLGDAAVRIARACNYVSAGTVEFLVDDTGQFYFLEVNARIQVEHPVTEEVTGIDLVAWQLRIAAGARLTLRQDQIRLEGHAIEARLYAEDPARAFLPQSGRILRWKLPAMPGIRIEHDLAEGDEVGVHYDPLLAKIVASGPDRESARRRLLSALADTTLLGVRTNKRFLQDVLVHEAFVEGWMSVEMLDHWRPEPVRVPPEAVAVAALICYMKSCESDHYAAELRNWTNSGQPMRSVCRFRCAGETFAVRVQASGSPPVAFRVTVGATPLDLADVQRSATQLSYECGGRCRRVDYALAQRALHLEFEGEELRFEEVNATRAQPEAAASDGRVRAPMAGVVVELKIEPGARVTRGDTLLVLESMKLLHTIAADIEGVVSELAIAPGDAVQARQLLAVVTPATAVSDRVDPGART